MKSRMLFYLLLICFTASSCSKFLERAPEGQLTELEALKDETGLVNFLNGAYTYFGDDDFLGGRVQVVSELLGDHLSGDKFTGDYAEIFQRRNSIFGDTRDDLYLKGYKIINVSNKVLDNINKAATQKNALEGQAKLFRAVAHFELVRLFAQPYGYSTENNHPGIPLRLTAGKESIIRSTVKEVYDQVIADLKSADDLLPETNGNYVTKYTAKAYLAKVYFQMNMFADAYNYADQVIKSNKYELDANYNVRFGMGQSKEAIFRIVTVDSATGFKPGGELRGKFRSDNQLPALYFTQEFFNKATGVSADVRKNLYSNSLQPGFLVLTKYNRDNFDVMLVHLTEIKLIRAEAGAELAGSNAAAFATGLADINELLTRAYGGTSRNLPVNSSAAQVINTVRNERELEMTGEGNRVQEIKRIGARTGLSVDRRGTPWNCNGFILQFPKSELDANASFSLNPESGCF